MSSDPTLSSVSKMWRQQRSRSHITFYWPTANIHTWCFLLPFLIQPCLSHWAAEAAGSSRGRQMFTAVSWWGMEHSSTGTSLSHAGFKSTPTSPRSSGSLQARTFSPTPSPLARGCLYWGSCTTAASHQLGSMPVPPGLTACEMSDDSKNWSFGRSKARE